MNRNMPKSLRRFKGTKCFTDHELNVERQQNVPYKDHLYVISANKVNVLQGLGPGRGGLQLLLNLGPSNDDFNKIIINRTKNRNSRDKQQFLWVKIVDFAPGGSKAFKALLQMTINTVILCCAGTCTGFHDY